MSSPKLTSKKGNKARVFKVLVLGQSGIGKTALIVRFVTRRFIFDYDSASDRRYLLQSEVAGEMVLFEIQDMAGQNFKVKGSTIEEHIKWADAFVLMFSTADSCSFNECTRLRFLINCVKKTKYSPSKGNIPQKEPPVMLIGNKKDLHYDTMVTFAEATEKCSEIGCFRYREISVKESVEESHMVFTELFRQYKLGYYSHAVVTDDDKRSSPELGRVRRYKNILISEGNSRENSHDKEIKRKMHRSIIQKVMPSFKPKSCGEETQL